MKLHLFTSLLLSSFPLSITAMEPLSSSLILHFQKYITTSIALKSQYEETYHPSHHHTAGKYPFTSLPISLESVTARVSQSDESLHFNKLSDIGYIGITFLLDSGSAGRVRFDVDEVGVHANYVRPLSSWVPQQQRRVIHTSMINYDFDDALKVLQDRGILGKEGFRFVELKAPRDYGDGKQVYYKFGRDVFVGGRDGCVNEECYESLEKRKGSDVEGTDKERKTSGELY